MLAGTLWPPFRSVIEHRRGSVLLCRAGTDNGFGTAVSLSVRGQMQPISVFIDSILSVGRPGPDGGPVMVAVLVHSTRLNTECTAFAAAAFVRAPSYLLRRSPADRRPLRRLCLSWLVYCLLYRAVPCTRASSLIFELEYSKIYKNVLISMSPWAFIPGVNFASYNFSW